MTFLLRFHILGRINDVKRGVLLDDSDYSLDGLSYVYLRITFLELFGLDVAEVCNVVNEVLDCEATVSQRLRILVQNCYLSIDLVP